VGGGKSTHSGRRGIYIDHAGFSKLHSGTTRELAVREILFRIVQDLHQQYCRSLSYKCSMFSHSPFAFFVSYSTVANAIVSHAKMTRDHKSALLPLSKRRSMNRVGREPHAVIFSNRSSAKFTFTHQVTPMGSPELSKAKGPLLPDDDDDMDNGR
jgi:hypothetical protein